MLYGQKKFNIFQFFRELRLEWLTHTTTQT